jgi:hypothetical protein
MSALGHKRTFALQYAMSALPSKADMCGALAHVRFGPIADIRRRLFDHIVSGQKNAIGYGDANRFRGLEIDY